MKLKYGVAVVVLLALAAFAPKARASSGDFSCTGNACVGTIVQNGSSYSSVGITLTADAAFTLPLGDGDEGLEGFTFAFNTSAKTISITDTDGDATLSSKIVSAGKVGNAIILNVLWSSPKGFASTPGFVSLQLASSGPCKTGSGTCFNSNSIDVPVTATPEPASLLLLGTGLLGIGAGVKFWAK